MRERGFTLVELMISMVLGLVVIGGATGVIIANRQSYRTNEGLSQVQESARTAFELLARDVRQAGVTGCDSNGRIANVVVSQSGTSPPWWQDWFGVRGYDGNQNDSAAGFGGSAPNNRISGTDSLQLQGLDGTGLSVVSHQPTSAQFQINTATTTLAPDDIVMVCDFDHAAIFKITNYNSSNRTVVHNTGAGSWPQNCSKGLGYPTDCSSTNGNAYAYGPNSQLARLAATDWYIGDNSRAAEGGRSLFRRRMSGAAEEIVAGVTNMQISYRESGQAYFVAAGSVGVWSNVNAMMITLTLQSADQRISTDTRVNSGRLERVLTNVITLRNRVP
jgi:type IV pilus assembly protein PilW